MGVHFALRIIHAKRITNINQAFVHAGDGKDIKVVFEIFIKGEESRIKFFVVFNPLPLS